MSAQEDGTSANIGRRSFLRGAAAVWAATAVSAVLSGCGAKPEEWNKGPAETAEINPSQVNNFRMLAIHINGARNIAALEFGKAHFSGTEDYKSEQSAIFKLYSIVVARDAILKAFQEYLPNEKPYNPYEEKQITALDELIPKLTIWNRPDFEMVMTSGLIRNEQKEKWFKVFPELREIAEKAKKGYK